MRSLAVVAVLASGLLQLACGSGTDPEPQDLSGVTSVAGAFLASFTPEPGLPVTGDNALGIELRDAKGSPVEHATIAIEPWMPAHGHGSHVQPKLSELGGGAYRAEDIYFTMPGAWELTLDVIDGSQRDTFVLSYDVK
jgi:hypothetical protein